MQRRTAGKRPSIAPTLARRGAPSDSAAQIARDVVRCTRCPRLRRYCSAIARTKRRAFRQQEYWGKPVPAFGDPRARLWILGLAPAAHGANRTGRMFTGDSSGDWLFSALHDSGFARLPSSLSRHDGQSLRDVYIGAVVRCAPPENKPTRDEIGRCAGFLARELVALERLRVLLCLGQIAFAAALRFLEDSGYEVPRPRPRFAHAAEFLVLPSRGRARGDAAGDRRRLPGDARPLALLVSYHPSRQNTQTGKLTRPMWDAIFRRARALLDEDR